MYVYVKCVVSLNILKRYYKDDISNIINYRKYILKYFIDFIYINLINQFTHNVATATQRICQLLQLLIIY